MDQQMSDGAVAAAISQRTAARELAADIERKLAAAGVVVEDKPHGTAWVRTERTSEALSEADRDDIRAAVLQAASCASYFPGMGEALAADLKAIKTLVHRRLQAQP